MVLAQRSAVLTLHQVMWLMMKPALTPNLPVNLCPSLSWHQSHCCLLSMLLVFPAQPHLVWAIPFLAAALRLAARAWVAACEYQCPRHYRPGCHSHPRAAQAHCSAVLSLAVDECSGAVRSSSWSHQANFVPTLLSAVVLHLGGLHPRRYLFAEPVLHCHPG